MESAQQPAVQKFGLPVSGWDELLTVEQQLGLFVERHHRAERRDIFRMFLQPPFTKQSLDLSLSELQAVTWERVKRMVELQEMAPLVVPWNKVSDVQHMFAGVDCLSMYDLSVGTTMGAQLFLCGMAINTMGTDEQREKFLPGIANCEYRGCLAMTELGHGSNVRDVETTATYDPRTKEFVVHTPSDSAQKFWIGNAVDAHLAVVIVQLYSNGQCHGVHGIVVQMRDFETNQLVPGVRLAECGHKIGMNGVSNGRIWFDNVRVPLFNLLSRYGSVDEDGSYSSLIADSTARFSICLAELLRGRVIISSMAVSAAKVCVGTAVRYGLTRRQFRVGDQERETLLMDYPMHQGRLLPYLALTYAGVSVAHHLNRRWEDRSEDMMARMSQMKDIHFLSAGFKAVMGWFARDAVQSAREACGGQGFASWNRIGPLKCDFEACLTYEGDNCVLLAQATRQLMKNYQKGQAQGKHSSASFLSHLNGLNSSVNPLSLTFPSLWWENDGGVGSFVDVSSSFDASLLRHPAFLLTCLQVREKLYLSLLSDRLEVARTKARRTLPENCCEDTAWNECGPLAVECGKAFFERLKMQWFWEDINEMTGKSSHHLLGKLASLCGLWLIQRDSRFCSSRALSSRQQEEMREEFGALLAEIRPHSRCLVDGLCVPDEFFGPIAWAGDGNDSYWSYDQATKNSTFTGKSKL